MSRKHNEYTIMRKFIYFLCSISLIACFTACNNNAAESYIGEYDYQSSGNITLGGVQNLIIDHEKGNMEVIQKDPTTLMLIFFAEDGNTYTTDATIEGNSVLLSPYHKLLTINYYITESSLLTGTTNRLITEDYQLTVYGTGTIHSNVITFTLQYSGQELSTGKKLVGNNITLIAKRKG